MGWSLEIQYFISLEAYSWTRTYFGGVSSAQALLFIMADLKIQVTYLAFLRLSLLFCKMAILSSHSGLQGFQGRDRFESNLKNRNSKNIHNTRKKRGNGLCALYLVGFVSFVSVMECLEWRYWEVKIRSFLVSGAHVINF